MLVGRWIDGEIGWEVVGHGLLVEWIDVAVAQPVRTTRLRDRQLCGKLCHVSFLLLRNTVLLLVRIQCSGLVFFVRVSLSVSLSLSLAFVCRRGKGGGEGAGAVE